MTRKTGTNSLRLPATLRKAAEELCKRNAISLDQFVVTAVAEKITAMNTAEFFAFAREPADWEAFARALDSYGASRDEPR